MYFIIELQTMGDGSCAHLVQTATSRNQAESIWHGILQYAAASTLPAHAAVILTSDGQLVASQCYTHDSAPEVVE